MVNVKEIQNIELASFTTMTTAISVFFSILSALVLSVIILVFIPEGQSIILYLIPTIIVGTFMFGIYNSFCEGLLYNLLSKKLKTIAFQLNNNEINKISTTETAIMISIILTIQAILLYLVSVFILPLLLSSIMQTLMLSGQQMIAYSIYQFIILISQPTTIALLIFGTFIITFVFVLIGAYIYNFIASTGRGIKLTLSKQNKLTVIEDVDAVRLGIVWAIVKGILSAILGIISVISGAGIENFLISLFSGFIGGFIEAFLIGLFYNLFGEKIGKIKLELIDLL